MIADALAVEVAALVFVDSLLPPPVGAMPLGTLKPPSLCRTAGRAGVRAPMSS